MFVIPDFAMIIYPRSPRQTLQDVQHFAVTAYSSFVPQSYVELGVDKGTPLLLKHNVTSAVANLNHGKSECTISLICDET
jgi:hypothetical protein